MKEREQYNKELDEFYAAYPADISKALQFMDEESARHPEWFPYRRKALIYETAAQLCEVHVFRHCPFYYELVSGRERDTWGFTGIGGWLQNQPFGVRYQNESYAWKEEYLQFANLGKTDTDLDHHCPGYDNLLKYGLKGIISRAEERMKTAATEKEKSFLESIIIGNRSLITISSRFSEKAKKMLETEHDPVIRKRLERIADRAARVPANPPETFYEALNTLLFAREIFASLEGIGESILGHLDRMLYPYYERDLEKNDITREEAKYLLSCFLAYTDVKFNIRSGKRNETSTTVVIGGCDKAGDVVYNDITSMVVEVYKELRLVNPKLNARTSAQHSDGYIKLLSDLIGSGINVTAVFNDDVIISANTRVGKALEDSRLYVGGGCQENMLQNTEINSRATVYVNLIKILEMSMFGGDWKPFAEHEGIQLESSDNCSTYEEVYQAYLKNLRTITGKLAERRNTYEREGWRFNPCPLHSSTVHDCIGNAMDMTEGGARYSMGGIGLIGAGTLIDSMYAIKTVVFDEKIAALSKLKKMLRSNFEGEEVFRQYLLYRVPKFGQDHEGMMEFSSRIFRDLADAGSGFENSRGGKYYADLFTYRTNIGQGEKTGATPDGRKAGEQLSQGMGPSLQSLGQKSEACRVLRALEPLDLTLFPTVGVLDMKLPWTGNNAAAVEIIFPVIKCFIGFGGSVLQLNVLDSQALLDARDHPHKYPDLVVRVCGYSAYFHALSSDIRDEIVNRALIERV